MFEIFRGGNVIATLIPEDVDLLVAEDKYVTLYSGGRSYVYESSVLGIMSSHPGKYVEVRRGVAARPDAIEGWFKGHPKGHWLSIKGGYAEYPYVRISRKLHRFFLEDYPKLAGRSVIDKKVKCNEYN